MRLVVWRGHRGGSLEAAHYIKLATAIGHCVF